MKRFSREVVPGGLHHAVAQYHGVPHLGAAQVKVAVLEAYIFREALVEVDREGRQLGRVEYLDGFRDDLHLAGGKLAVHGFRRTFLHRPQGAHAELAADFIRCLSALLRYIRGIHHQLDQARDVPQFNKGDAPEVSFPVNPSVEGDVLIHITRRHFSAIRSVLKHISTPLSGFFPSRTIPAPRKRIIRDISLR